MPAYPTPKTLTVGGRTITEAEVERMYTGTTGIILSAANITAGRGTSFRTGAGVDYQVPSGKTLKVLAMRMSSPGVAARATIGHSTAVVTIDSASPGTSPVYYGGSLYNAIGLSPTQSKEEWSIYFTVAQNLWPFMYSSGGETSVVIYCLID